ncbi:rCG28605, partial [Rattus norvegicus]
MILRVFCLSFGLL